MIRNSREKEFPTKQEEGIVDDRASASSRLWLGQRNPRIVRVSRAFGGKDRHSKVSTIRGLRDRRVRLSVPTAIQLYDLQDRLGLNQPSKVVDWLLNAAQHEIDKLPPLPMQPGNFIQFSQSLMTHKEETPPQSPSQPHPLSLLSSKSNSDDMGNAVLVDDTPMELGIEKGNFLKVSEVENQEVGIHGAHGEAHESLRRMSHASFSGLLTNSMPYTSYYHLEQSNPYATHMGIHSAQLEVPPVSVPGSQLVLCPSGAIPSMFQPYMATSTDFDARQFGQQLQMGSSISQNLPSNPTRTYLLSGDSAMRSFYSNLASKHQHSQDHHGS